MDSLLKLALSSQSILGGIQFLLCFISLIAVPGALQHYHANDRLTFKCFPEPPGFNQQLCYDQYTSTVSPWLIPRNVTAITYGTLCVCWISFMLYRLATLRQREQVERNKKTFLSVYTSHVCFRLMFLSVMLGLFCIYQTLDLPRVFECSTFLPQTTPTTIPVNQTETVIQCNDLHYKEKSNLNIAIIVIEASIIILAILELIDLFLHKETFVDRFPLLELPGADQSEMKGEIEY